MRLLVLCGTRFLGRALVEDALARPAEGVGPARAREGELLALA